MRAEAREQFILFIAPIGYIVGEAIDTARDFSLHYGA
jgi:hypothetical protein